MAPYRIRMFAEIGCSFALWGDPGRPLPGTGEVDAEDLEQQLPISPELRDALLAWADRHNRWDAEDRTIDMTDFDEEGRALSVQLQGQLGSDYLIDFRPTFGAAPDS